MGVRHRPAVDPCDQADSGSVGCGRLGTGCGPSRPDRRAACGVSEAAQVTVSSRLHELGITLPKVAKPLAAYVPAVRSGNLVYTAGQLPTVDGELAGSGKVGGEVSPEQGKRLARVCALNALAAVDSVVGVDAITRVVKVVGFVASAPGFTGQPGVVNGASELSLRCSVRPGRTRGRRSASRSCRSTRR